MSVQPAPEALLHKAREVLASGMLDATATAAPPSPCVSVCRLDVHQQHCEGCLRTLPELRQWGAASAPEKRAMWRAIVQRCGLHVPPSPREGGAVDI